VTAIVPTSKTKRPAQKNVTKSKVALAKRSLPTGEGRVVIEAVRPMVDCGARPAKRVVGDLVEVSADIFCDGHEKIAATVLYRFGDEGDWQRSPMHFVDNDRWAGQFRVERCGRHSFTIEAWRDPFATWHADVEKKNDAGQSIDLELVEGAEIIKKAREQVAEEHAGALDALLAQIAEADGAAKWRILSSDATQELMAEAGIRLNVSALAEPLPLNVDRVRAQFSAWYELFPRSAGNDPHRHGTFDDVIGRLGYVRDLGFDVLYLPPIHPIGTTNRKGKNNSLSAAPDDPGSVYAIGSPDGGHDAIHPQLGSLDDFRRLIAAAREHGLEVAIDFAVQCSPDHPWIKEHPEWFDWRPDGTIKYAENPPKKYQDIVNVHFYRDALPGIWLALRDIVLFWVENGVRIFRVDNPHTKPLPFWEWLIAQVNERDPEVLFLSEAFTRPKMMKRLAKIGFQQSYTYFTWRDTKAELTDYIHELAGEMSDYYRPNFFTNTPDINPFYLQNGGRPGFVVRATLAATLSSNWGIYSGFELCEAAPLPGREEYLDSEKYQLRARDFDAPGNIRNHITALNRIRRENPALHDFRNTAFLNAWNDNILYYFRATPARDNVLVIMVNLDPRNAQTADYELPLWEFGLPDSGTIKVEDLVLGIEFKITGKVQSMTLDPAERSVVIWRLSL
jgi:starch synthase (maltosyl-transferring)